MTKSEIYKNQELGRLIQYGYDLHKRDFKACSRLPFLRFSIGGFFDDGKIHKNGGMFGDVIFANHTDEYALISLVIMRDLSEDPLRPVFIQTTTNNYFPHFYRLINNPETKFLEHDDDFDELEEDNQINIFIDCLEFLGFRKEDILKVINNQMTAREAYQNVAPEEYKNRQWICYYRKFYEFDGNVAIDGKYSGLRIDNFPFPFTEQPILDCSKVGTGSICFGLNKKRVKLINVNSNSKSIHFTDLRCAIIDEVIDASKVGISGTRFGEQKVINLDSSLDKYLERDIALAYTDNEKENKKKKINIMCNGSSTNAIIEGLSDGAMGIGLFRDESVLENNPEIVSELLDIINYRNWRCYDDDPIYNKVYNAIYNNTSKIYSIAEDKKVIFRLSDIKVSELSINHPIEVDDEFYQEYRGADALYKMDGVFDSEVKAIIDAAKEKKKTAYILIPYFIACSDFKGIKLLVEEISKKENYDDVKIGAMIENVESANLADDIAEIADFISIGTNDLTESVLNKKRSIDDSDFSILNEDVKKYIRKIVHRVKAIRDIPINICGEHANNIENLEFYLSLDIDTITCNSSLVPSYINIISCGEGNKTLIKTDEIV